VKRDLETIRNKLTGKGLKVTPQRIAVLQAIYNMDSHPTAEQIIDSIHKSQPNIAIGTVYKVLQTLVENELVKKLKTERDILRYDGIISNHHHLYCIECAYIEDYENTKLDELLKKFFQENKIDNFEIEDIKLQINGKFIKHKYAKH